MASPASAPPSPDDLLTRAEVAARLGKTLKQISNMQARGQILAPLTIPGIGVRWSRWGLEQWLATAIVVASRPRPAGSIPASDPHTARTLAPLLRAEAKGAE